MLAKLTLFSALAILQQGGMTEADANKDEAVDAAELKSYVSGKLPDFDRFDELMKELDKDGDGSLDETEFDARMRGIQAILQRPKPEAKPEKPVEFAERYEALFAKRDPKLEATIAADLAAFDGSGKPFKFQQARGKYAVIVFGCLT